MDNCKTDTDDGIMDMEGCTDKCACETHGLYVGRCDDDCDGFQCSSDCQCDNCKEDRRMDKFNSEYAMCTCQDADCYKNPKCVCDKNCACNRYVPVDGNPQCDHDRSMIELGSYSTKEEALRAQDAYNRKHTKGFPESELNFPSDKTPMTLCPCPACCN